MSFQWVFKALLKVKHKPEYITSFRTIDSDGRPVYVSGEQADRLTDPDVSDSDNSEMLTRSHGSLIRVATITGDFEVRRVQLEFSVTGTSLLDEDVRVMTFHMLKLSGGAPISTWDQADYDAAVGWFTTWHGTLRGLWRPEMVWSAIKFYKAGPAIVPPQVPAYSLDKNEPGTATTVTMPPQVAISVTEIAGVKKGWGRFYLPAPVTSAVTIGGTLTNAGRPATGMLTAIADYTDALYESAITANIPFVVYRPKLEANRPTGSPPSPSELPERPANAQVVEQIQIDDVYDVIRRRRWDHPTLRVQRSIGSPAGRTLEAHPSPATDESTDTATQ